MKKSLIVAAVLVALLAAITVISVTAVSGAAFTTYNPWVDGAFKEVCKNSLINCNIYGMKQDVWLNGGPAANGLGPDGQYFFAVLVPGGQPNPNDNGAKNLSDDYDLYTDRTFTVTGGEVSAYSGPHWLDSGDFIDPNRKTCNKPRGCAPDGQPPLIRLYPYADTWNPGGVYILAICYIGDGSGYPVEPRDCKYDAFKVKQGYTASLLLSGMKFEDMFADGKADWVDFGYQDPGLPDWDITIDGTGFLGEPIHEIVQTDASGFWSYAKEYTYNKFTVLVPAELTVCEVLKPGWTQSYPDPACYDLTIQPAALAEVADLDFGNWYPGEKSGLKFEDLDADGEAQEAGEPGLSGWTIFVDYDGNGDLDAGEPSAVTGADGTYTITGIKPGTYQVYEVLQAGWTCSYPEDCYYEHTFYSRAVFEGNDFGNWYPATKGGYKWYDANGNGVWDAGEPAIPGWKIEIWDNSDPAVLVASQYTDSNGYYEFSLTPGTYTVKEVCPAVNWFQTWPVPLDLCGTGTYPITLVSSQVETDNDFGNYCTGAADFGTKGYWHNKNGLGELYNDSTFEGGLLVYVNGLDPYNDPSGYFDNGEEPFDGYDEWGNEVPPAIDSFSNYGILYNEISQFLVDPNAGGGGGDQEQLAQQLLAFIFNVNYRLDGFGAAIWVNGQWMSAQSVIDAAVGAWSSPGTDDDKVWEPILDGLNNNDAVPFIHAGPCDFAYP